MELYSTVQGRERKNGHPLMNFGLEKGHVCPDVGAQQNILSLHSEACVPAEITSRTVFATQYSHRVKSHVYLQNAEKRRLLSEDSVGRFSLVLLPSDLTASTRKKVEEKGGSTKRANVLWGVLSCKMGGGEG